MLDGNILIFALLLCTQESDLEFVVVRQPVRGNLVRHVDETTTPAIQFDVEDLVVGRISYEHDQTLAESAGEAATDAFTVVACLSLRGKRSEPRTVHVAIAARNIQPPYLTNHRVLKVNVGMDGTVTAV